MDGDHGRRALRSPAVNCDRLWDHWAADPGTPGWGVWRIRRARLYWLPGSGHRTQPRTASDEPGRGRGACIGDRRRSSTAEHSAFPGTVAPHIVTDPSLSPAEVVHPLPRRRTGGGCEREAGAVSAHRRAFLVYSRRLLGIDTHLHRIPVRARSDSCSTGPLRHYARTRLRNSCRVRESYLRAPRNAEVTVTAPGFWTPRSDMHRCSASTITPTPRGSSVSSSQSAT